MNWPNNELSKLVIINITVDQINEKLLQAILLDILRQQLVGLVALFRGGHVPRTTSGCKESERVYNLREFKVSYKWCPCVVFFTQ